MDEEGEEPLSQMSLAELKRRGYSLDEISRIFTGEPIPSSRYPAGSFATPASRPYRPATGNGATNGANGASRPMRRGTPFPPPALPRRAAPVGTYTPSLAPYPAPSPAKKQWSPVGAIKSHARTPSVSKIGATPRATPSTLAGRRHVSVRKTPAGSREMPGAADTTSATAHRILATLGKIPSPLPSDRLTDARSMQKTLGKRHLETPSSSRDAENGHGRRPSVKPPPIAKRQRLDEDSFARVPHKAKTALHDDYYEREHEEEEEEETYGEEGRTTTQDEQLRGREREESSTSFGLPKPSRTDKRPSSALPSDSEHSAPSFISPIVASESIFSYKATTVVNGKAKEDEEEEEEEQTLTKRKRKEQESPRPVGLALKGKDEGEAAAAAATEEKKEPAPFASLPSFGMPSTSASSAPSTSFFAMGASSAPAPESASAGSVDFGGFAMPAKDSKKDEAAAPKTDFSGFSFGKTEGTSVLSDTFSSFIAPHPSTAAAVESAPAAVSFGGFSVPVAAKKDGWECACCTESNPESATSCGVCMVPRPAPKAAAPVAEAAKKEEEKPAPATSFGSFLPVSADAATKPESPKPEASPVLKETVVAVKDKETTAAPTLASPFTFGFSADTSKPKEKETKEPAPVAEEKPALAFSAEKPKEEAKPATDLFGGFKSDFKSDFGSGSTPSFGTSTFSLTSSTPSTSLSLSASTESSATSAAATSLFAPSSSTGMQKPFMFGSTDQDKAKEEPPKQKETAAPASAPFNFGFGGSAFGAPAKKEEEDTMADSAEPSASTAASAPFGGSTFAAPSSTPAASSIFSFGAPAETPSLPATSAPSSGMFMFGGSAPASAPAPSLTASGSFPFGSTASTPAFPAATSSAFTAPSTSTSFGGFGAPSSGGESAFSPAASVFGAPQAAAPTSTFGASAPFSSPFGASTGATSTFGSAGAFGDTGSSLASSGTFATTPFGAQPAAPTSFGGGAFGAQPSAAAASPFPTFGGAPSASFGAAPAPAAGGAFSLGAAPAAAPGGRRVLRGARRGRGGAH